MARTFENTSDSLNSINVMARKKRTNERKNTKWISYLILVQFYPLCTRQEKLFDLMDSTRLRVAHSLTQELSRPKVDA